MAVNVQYRSVTVCSSVGDSQFVVERRELWVELSEERWRQNVNNGARLDNEISEAEIIDAVVDNTSGVNTM